MFYLTLEFRHISVLLSNLIEYAPTNAEKYSTSFPADGEKAIDIELANLVLK